MGTGRFEWAGWTRALIALALFVPGAAHAQATLIAHYDFDDCTWPSSGTVTDSVNGYDGDVVGSVSRDATATSGLKPDTCAAGSFNGGQVDISPIGASTSAGDKTSVSMWIYWDGTNSVMPNGWYWYDIWMYNGSIGFNSSNSDIYGISSSGLANSWNHFVFVYHNGDVQQSKMYLNGVQQTLSQRRGSPRNGRAYADTRFAIGGWYDGSNYRFRTRIDEVKVYDGEVTQAQVDADYAATTSTCDSCSSSSGATKIASYDFDGDWDTTGTLEDGIGSADGTESGTTSKVSAPASGSKPDTCDAADFGGGKFDISGLAVSTSAGDKTSVTFWMKWDGTNSVMPLGFYRHDLFLYSSSFGFNTWNWDVYGVSSSGFANTWKHVGAVFVNGNVTAERLWIDGVEQSLSQRRSSTRNSNAYVNPRMVIGGVWSSTSYRFRGEIDSVNVYDGEVSDAQVLADMNEACDSKRVEYEMEQAEWTGSSGEIIDTSTHGHDATAIDGPTTAGSGPAIAGDPGTCQYGEFDGSDDYIELPSSFPNLQSSFTIAAWIRPTSTSLGDARIFADDENNTGGFALSLGDGGSNRLRFFSRSVSPVSVDTTSAPISEDTWQHVAAVHDATAQTRQIYVDGVAQTLTGGSTAPTYAGSWGTDSGPVSIGGETSGSSESSANFHFEGQIDEVHIYEAALSAAEIAALYAETHVCTVVSGVDHFDFDFGSASASTCAAKTITITACENSACSSALTSYTGTIDLSTSSGHGTWAVTTGDGTLSPAPDSSDDGSASYTFRTSDNGVVELTLSNAHADDLTITATDTADSVSSTSSTISFSDNAFVITPDPVTVAGRDQSTTATLWQRYGSDCSIATAYTGTQPLEVWITRSAADPGGAAPTIGGTSVPSTASTTFDIDFTNGVGTFDLTTADVGQYVLHLRDDTRSFATGVDIASDSTTITTRPFGFDLDVSDASGGANPGASGPSGGVFAAAGEAFRVEARAVTWQAADDSNDDGIPDGHTDGDPSTGANLDDNGNAVSFGGESPAETVALSGALELPAGGNDPGFTSSAITSFTSGAGSISDAVFGEVGIIEIEANVSDNAYLGGDDVRGASGYVGRFVPDHFQLTGATLQNRTDSATQSACASSFSFLDEEIELRFDIAARNASGTTTQNYTGSYAKLASVASLGGASGASTDAINLVGQHGSDVYTPADRLSGSVPSISFTNGTTDSSVELAFEMDRLGSLAPETPFTGVLFAVNPTDSDGVESNGSTSISVLGSPQDFASIGTTDLYYGRIVVENAHGSELAPLPVWIHTEYCAAVDATPVCTQWTDLSRSVSNDDCSRLAITAPSDTALDGYWQGSTTYSAGSEALFQVFDSVQNRGGGGFRLNYTGGGNGIQTTVPDLGSDTVETWHDYLILEPGTVTFGIYKGREPVIYMREAY